MYTAQWDSTTSIQSLRNPYNTELTIGTNFLANTPLTNLITDTHFAQRDRMGRLVAFVDRIVADSWASIADDRDRDPSKRNCSNPKYGGRGIGVDEATALLIEEDMSVSITSWTNEGAAYLLCLDHSPRTCEPDRDLEVSNIAVTRLSGNTTAAFNLQNWKVLNKAATASYSLSAANGRLISSQKGGNVY